MHFCLFVCLFVYRRLGGPPRVNPPLPAVPDFPAVPPVPAALLGAADLPERLRVPAPTSARLLGDLPEEGLSLEAVERELIERALRKCGGNQSATARYLGITRNTLLYRIEKYGLR